MVNNGYPLVGRGQNCSDYRSITDVLQYPPYPLQFNSNSGIEFGIGIGGSAGRVHLYPTGVATGVPVAVGSCAGLIRARADRGNRIF